MITFVCWKWKARMYRHTFTAEHVNAWAAGLGRTYQQPHRTICITDDPVGVDIETFPIWNDHSFVENPSGAHLPSCYRRLKLFSEKTTRELGIKRGSRVVWIDLDVVFVKDTSPIFEAFPGEPFVGWQGISQRSQRVVYNGTLVMFAAGGSAQAMWDDFDPVRSPYEVNKNGYFGSDQGWISFRCAGKVPGVDHRQGMVSFTRDMMHGSKRPPEHARLISFNGKEKPWDPPVMARNPWITQHWGK